MAERLTGSPERSDGRSPRQKLTTLLAAVGAMTVAEVAAAKDAAPEKTPDQLVRMIGEQKAQEIRAALDECLGEYREIAEEIEADGDPEGAQEALELGEEDCGDGQQRDIQLALLDKQIADAKAATSALNAETAALDTETAAFNSETAELQAESAELAEINEELAQLMTDRAICEAGGGTECDANDARIEDLFQRARELVTPSADREQIDVTEAVPKGTDTQVAQLED